MLLTMHTYLNNRVLNMTSNMLNMVKLLLIGNFWILLFVLLNLCQTCWCVYWASVVGIVFVGAYYVA